MSKSIPWLFSLLFVCYLGWTIYPKAQTTPRHVTPAQALNLIDISMQALQEYNQIPGIALGIVYDQELIYEKYYGLANREKKTAINGDTLFSICSISKLFTSVGAMTLIEDKKLSLEDTPSQVLPWFNLQQAFKNGPDITLKSLLTHSSGLPRESDFNYWIGRDYPFPTKDKLMTRLKEQKTLYASSETFQYSNLGLSLVGEMVEAQSQQPFSQYIQNQILNPLKMTKTQIDLPLNMQNQDFVAKGYGAKNRKGLREAVNYFRTEAITPAAGFWSSVNDLSKFAQWQFRLLDDSHGKKKEIIKGNSLKSMHRIQWMDENWESKYGLGFSVRRNNGQTLVGHSGGCPGFNSNFSLNRDKKLAVIILTNANGVRATQMTDMVFDILSKTKVSKKTLNQKEKRNPLNKYFGFYDSFPFGSEMVIYPWKDGLGSMRLPASKPLRSQRFLKRIKNNEFQVMDRKQKAKEKVIFKAKNNKIHEVHWHSTHLKKIR